jgi:hypothetical protein
MLQPVFALHELTALAQLALAHATQDWQLPPPAPALPIAPALPVEPLLPAVPLPPAPPPPEPP